MAILDVSGQWEIIQTNGYTVDIRINQVQPSGEFAVTASYTLQGRTEVGSGFGSVSSYQFRCEISWLSGSKGVYIGEIDINSGVLRGATFDASAPDTFAGWYSSKTF